MHGLNSFKIAVHSNGERIVKAPYSCSGTCILKEGNEEAAYQSNRLKWGPCGL